MQHNYWTRPTLSSCHLMPCLPSRCLTYCLHTGSSAHLGVTGLRPSIPKNLHPPLPHPSLPDNDSSSPLSYPPCLPDSCHCCYHAAAATLLPKSLLEWYSAVVLQTPIDTTARATPPPPSYPIYFSQTSNIGRRATHSATIAFLLFMYPQRGLVPSAWITLSTPSFCQVPSPSLQSFIPFT